jgi:serine/threonine protein kinase
VITPKDRAKFMNFGLAAFTAGGVGRLSTAAPYVSPEELAGKPADARSDIYSLGAVMFEMFTGRQRARGLVLSGLNPACRPSSSKSSRACSPPPSSIARRARGDCGRASQRRGDG